MMQSISSYINPNTRGLTSNYKNTAIKDKETYNEAMSQHLLNPVEDLVQVLKTPIKLAKSSSLSRQNNSVNIAEGQRIRVNGGHVLTVTAHGVEVSGGDNPYDTQSYVKAQRMADALASMLRNAGGTMTTVGHSIGTAVMLNCAKAAWELPDGSFKEGKKFLHVSTDEVYGSLEDDGTYFYETTPYAPHSPYSASKASSDMLVKAYIDTYHFPANITNCSNNYGPYQFPEKLIPLIINNALHGKKLPVYGDGKNVRDWLYVDDHAKAIDMVQENGRLGETYNVGGHNEKQNIEIINIIIDTLLEMLPADDPRRALVSKDLITYVKDRKGHDRRYAIAPDKIKAEIGWEPETMFKEGIKKTIAWYFEHEDWMKNVTSGDYQKYYEDMYQNR